MDTHGNGIDYIDNHTIEQKLVPVNDALCETQYKIYQTLLGTSSDDREFKKALSRLQKSILD